MRIYFFCFITILGSCFAAAQNKSDRDTMYHAEPVTIIASHASERISPVTFSNLSRSEIKQQYSVQDVPVLLSPKMPSTTFYSENGNGTGGYSYITLRGFAQQRLSVMVNGVPQNDPEDFNVYWIDFPDLLGSPYKYSGSARCRQRFLWTACDWGIGQFACSSISTETKCDI